MSLIEVDMMILLKRRSYIPTLPDGHHDKIERTCAAPPFYQISSMQAGYIQDSNPFQCIIDKPKISSRAPEAASVILFAVFKGDGAVGMRGGNVMYVVWR